MNSKKTPTCNSIFFDDTNNINPLPINIINIKNRIFLIEKKYGDTFVIEKDANIKRQI